MAIQVYTLKNAIVSSSVEEYLRQKAEFKKQKALIKANFHLKSKAKSTSKSTSKSISNADADYNLNSDFNFGDDFDSDSDVDFSDRNSNDEFESDFRDRRSHDEFESDFRDRRSNDEFESDFRGRRSNDKYESDFRGRRSNDKYESDFRSRRSNDEFESDFRGRRSNDEFESDFRSRRSNDEFESDFRDRLFSDDSDSDSNSYENLDEFKMKKAPRNVFISSTDTAEEALHLAGIDYENEIDLNAIEFCKVEALHQCIYGNLHIPKLGNVLEEQFDMIFFVNRRNIVIIDDSGFAGTLMRRIITGKTKPGQSREKFLYNFCARFMDQDLENLGRYSKKIMKIEELIDDDELDDITSTITQIRKELLVLREYYDELMDLGKQLEENENHFFSGKNLEYFGIISDRADRLMGRTMYLLDYLSQVQEAYRGKVAEQQNDNMRFLTIMSTVFYPLTLITGWYGMNFKNMPELVNGYPFVIGLSVIVVVTILLICKKKHIL